MTAWNGEWRPSAMKGIESDSAAPKGFRNLTLAGLGLKCEIIEPIQLSNIEDWDFLTSELESWGQVPESKSINSISTEEKNRGLVALISAENEWIADFLPWNRDSQLSMISEAKISVSIPYIGGYKWEGKDIIAFRKNQKKDNTILEKLESTIKQNDVENTNKILYKCGSVLGQYHSEVESILTTPYDHKRWNSRIESLEEKLRASFIWRGKFSKKTPCIISLRDVRFSDFQSGKIAINRPRLSDCLEVPNCDFPAIRDLSSLIHDLSRMIYRLNDRIDITSLRSSLIEGWKSTAPEDWASKEAFYAYYGGLVIWEYEQCLLDVIEATANQSGPPEPAITTLAYVKSFQKKMFNNRTIAMLGWMGMFFGASSIINSIPFELMDLPIPLIFFTGGFGLLKYYQKLSPPPEFPLNKSFL